MKNGLFFFLKGPILKHNQTLNKTLCLIYSSGGSHLRINFREKISHGIKRQLLFLQLNTAPLVSVIVEETPTRVGTTSEKNMTSKNYTNQNTTRTTHNNWVRERFCRVTKQTILN